MDTDETVLMNDVSRCGLRRVHVMRSGKPVDQVKWLLLVTPEEMKTLGWMEFQEEGLAVWHLWVWWDCKGPANLTPRPPSRNGKGVAGILWKVSKGERVSEVVKKGAELHLAYYDRWPERAVMRKVPPGARPVVIQEKNLEVGDEEVAIGVEERKWVPEGCVFLFCESGGVNGTG